MITYYSTFITGLQEVVEDALKKRLKDFQIDLILDGLILYKSSDPLEKILNIRFFNNTSLLIYFLDEKKIYSLKDLIKNFWDRRNSIKEPPSWIMKGKRSFRVIASEENHLVSIDKKTLGKLEHFLGKMLKLKVNRAKPDVEVWFLKRREGYCFVGIRLTKTPNYEKILRKGELRPELAHILCLLSEPEPSDIFLDPFAGSGAIPIERTNFSYREIIAGDKDPQIYKELKRRIDKLRKRVRVVNWDALDLRELRNGAINKVVTDPPWGIYEQGKFDLSEFYQKMVKEFLRILKKDGLMVILTAQKELFEKILKQFSGKLLVVKRYNTLVSGKKAAIYKIKKV